MELQIVEQAVAAASDKTCEGKVATYIPELGKADGSRVGVSVFSRSGGKAGICAQRAV